MCHRIVRCACRNYLALPDCLIDNSTYQQRKRAVAKTAWVKLE